MKIKSSKPSTSLLIINFTLFKWIFEAIPISFACYFPCNSAQVLFLFFLLIFILPSTCLQYIMMTFTMGSWYIDITFLKFFLNCLLCNVFHSSESLPCLISIISIPEDLQWVWLCSEFLRRESSMRLGVVYCPPEVYCTHIWNYRN